MKIMVYYLDDRKLALIAACKGYSLLHFCDLKDRFLNLNYKTTSKYPVSGIIIFIDNVKPGRLDSDFAALPN